MNQFAKSGVREIRTLRSVGASGEPEAGDRLRRPGDGRGNPPSDPIAAMRG